MANMLDFKNFDEEFFEEEYEDMSSLVEETLEYAQEDGSALYDMFKYEIRWITLKIANGELDRDELRGYFKLAMQGIYGHIKAIDNRGEPAKLTVVDKEVELSYSGSSFADVFTIMDGFTYAVVCRNQQVLDLIFSLEDRSPLLGEGRHRYHPVYHQYVLFKNEKEVTEQEIEDFIKSAERYEANDSEVDEYYGLIDHPRRKLLREYFLGDAESFNDQLADSLYKHQEYYDSLEDNRFRSVDDWLPWEIISNACKAYDKGWDITVKDPRLPMFLVKGECKVESLK